LTESTRCSVNYGPSALFFSELGAGTSAASLGDAFSVALVVQAAFALTAAALVSRARQSTRGRAPGGMPAGEGA
jgi:hypothetical protein